MPRSAIPRIPYPTPKPVPTARYRVGTKVLYKGRRCTVLGAIPAPGGWVYDVTTPTGKERSVAETDLEPIRCVSPC